MVGSIPNMGVWDKVAAARVKAEVRRTLEGEAVARRHYQETGLSLENAGCVGDLHVVVERCLVFLCILHCWMAMGRLEVAFIEVRLEDLPKDNTVAVQRVLYRAPSGAKWGASASPNGEAPRDRCTMAKFMAAQSPPPSFFSPCPLPLVSPSHGPRKVEAPVGEHVESPRRPPVMLVVLVVAFCVR